MCRKRPGGFSVAFSMHQIYGTGSMPRMHAPDLCPGVFFRALARRFKFLNDGSWRRIPKIPFCGQTTDKCGFFINPTFFDPCAHFLCGIFFVNYFPTPLATQISRITHPICPCVRCKYSRIFAKITPCPSRRQPFSAFCLNFLHPGNKYVFWHQKTIFQHLKKCHQHLKCAWPEKTHKTHNIRVTI